MSAQFECAWQELRPVPQVFIDFGNGRTLRRTLQGNIATWITDAHGRALDVVPALYRASKYRQRLADALELFGQLAGRTPAKRSAKLEAYHRARAAQAEARKQIELRRESIRPRDFLSKGLVERPLKQALRKKPVPKPAPKPARKPNAADGKTKRTLMPDRPKPRDASALLKDEIYNASVREAKAQRMLAATPDARVSELTERFFLEVLQVDLEDPYLGLAPYVLGGEGGRR